MQNVISCHDLDTIYKVPNFLQEQKLAEATEEERLAQQRAEAEKAKGCEKCEGYCPDVTGDPHCDDNYCSNCGRPLRSEGEHE